MVLRPGRLRLEAYAIAGNGDGDVAWLIDATGAEIRDSRDGQDLFGLYLTLRRSGVSPRFVIVDHGARRLLGQLGLLEVLPVFEDHEEQSLGIRCKQPTGFLRR